MRVLFAGLILAAATSTGALAQRVDTRRIDIKPGPVAPFNTCRFTAVDGLALLETSTDGSTGHAFWSVADGSATLALRFSPISDDPTRTLVDSVDFSIESAHAPASVRLRFDGTDSPIRLKIVRLKTPGIYKARPGENDRGRFVEAAIAAQSAEIELLDAKGVSLGRHAFDVGKVRRIPELLELVHWNCTSPDRG